MERVLQRDRVVVIAALALLTVTAWSYMVYEARDMTLTGACHCVGMSMSGPDVAPWASAALIPLFLMWMEMMVAMMIPSVAPMILTFALVARRRAEEARPYVPTGIFLLGYLAAWTGFSAVAAAAQWFLHGLAILSPTMVSTSRFFGAAVLIAAGVFQWTPMKRACLRHCRSPLSFLMTGWKESQFGVFAMGLKHGVYCTGCCWLLMALLFVGGVMNLWWIAVIAGLVLLEKILPETVFLERLIGVLLVLWGIRWIIVA